MLFTYISICISYLHICILLSFFHFTLSSSFITFDLQFISYFSFISILMENFLSSFILAFFNLLFLSLLLSSSILLFFAISSALFPLLQHIAGNISRFTGDHLECSVIAEIRVQGVPVKLYFFPNLLLPLLRPCDRLHMWSVLADVGF